MLRACERQWRVGFSGAIGLDFPAVFQIADRVLGIEITEEVFERLKVAEDEWLSVLSEKREAEEAEMKTKAKASPAGHRKTNAR